MALDNANFIAELSITDPPGTDPLSQGDDQIRTIKRATFQSFPNIAAQVSLTDAQLNLAAIKNEANVFTGLNTFNVATTINAPLAADRGILQFDEAGVVKWRLLKVDQTTSGDLTVERFVGGAFADVPWSIDAATGVVDFAHAPTVAGAPLWIAGELRMFIATAAPGTNWFLADGTNGTVNLLNRAPIASGSSVAGTLVAANLSGTAAAGTTGSTAITTAQMPVHAHRLFNGSQAGVTDTTFGHVGQQTMAGANRGAAPGYTLNSNWGDQIIENSGSGSGHTHTSPAQAVSAVGDSRDVVRSHGFIAEFHQYVP